jgi:3-hydroxyisobutyrate dehydrogenase-like beta-hydroxyacid dehydrogenase
MSNRPLISIVGMGQMGSAIAARCVARGCRVTSPLGPRSQASRERALAAGVEPCELADLSEAQAVISLVPSSQACNVVAQVLGHAGDRPLIFIEANALSPASKSALASRFDRPDQVFLDAVIIGHPPGTVHTDPRLYICGDETKRALFLREFGLDIRALDGPIGSAAALKMCYAGLNKGLTGLTAATLLAAERAGIADSLLAEWGLSQAFLLNRSKSALPAMYPKARRWMSEFEEIAEFVGDETTAGSIFKALAGFFEERADAAEDGEEFAAITTRLNRGESNA